MIPDPGEQIDMRGERMADELYRNGQWHCVECEQPIQPGHEIPSSTDPASAPICRTCETFIAVLAWAAELLKDHQAELRLITQDDEDKVRAILSSNQ
jgi:hypothetical protein